MHSIETHYQGTAEKAQKVDDGIPLVHEMYELGFSQKFNLYDFEALIPHPEDGDERVRLIEDLQRRIRAYLHKYENFGTNI